MISGTELPAGKLPSDLIAGSFGGNNVVILWKIGVQIFLDVIGKASVTANLINLYRFVVYHGVLFL